MWLTAARHQQASKQGTLTLAYAPPSPPPARQCTGYYGPCTIEKGCNPDGSCVECMASGDPFDYVRQWNPETNRLDCLEAPRGCPGANTTVNGTCTACMEGYVLLANNTCVEVSHVPYV